MSALPILADEAPAGSLEHVGCAVCGADVPKPLFVKNGLTVVRCRRCGFAYVNPRPVWPEVARIYRDEVYYRNGNTCDFGYGDYIGDDQYLLRPLFALRVDGIERHHPTRGRLLDVGCATGLLLEEACSRGWAVEGVDVSEFAVAWCRERGLTAHLGSLESVALSGKFDVIVMDDTIEHLPDPRRTLAEMYRLLTPGGILTINTCDEGGLLRRAMGRHWFHYKPLEHLCYFNRRNLARMLDESGFTVLETQLSGKLVTLRYLCQRLRSYSPLGSKVALSTLALLPGARRPFFLPLGEFLVFARRR